MWVRITGQSVTDLSVSLQKSEPSPYILRLFKEKFKKTRYVVRNMQLSVLGYQDSVIFLWQLREKHLPQIVS